MILIRDIDAVDTEFRRYVATEDLPPKDQLRCMLLDAASDVNGSARIPHLGYRIIVKDDTHYILSKTFRNVYIKFTGKYTFQVRVTNDDLSST